MPGTRADDGGSSSNEKLVKFLVSQVIQGDFASDEDPKSTFYSWNGKQSKMYDRDNSCPDGFISKNGYCWGKFFRV